MLRNRESNINYTDNTCRQSFIKRWRKNEKIIIRFEKNLERLKPRGVSLTVDSRLTISSRGWTPDVNNKCINKSKVFRDCAETRVRIVPMTKTAKD